MNGRLCLVISAWSTRLCLNHPGVTRPFLVELAELPAPDLGATDVRKFCPMSGSTLHNDEILAQTIVVERCPLKTATVAILALRDGIESAIGSFFVRLRRTPAKHHIVEAN